MKNQEHVCIPKNTLRIHAHSFEYVHLHVPEPCLPNDLAGILVGVSWIASLNSHKHMHVTLGAHS